MKHTERILIHRNGYKPFYREQLVGSDKAKEYLKKIKRKKDEESKTKAKNYLDKVKENKVSEYKIQYTPEQEKQLIDSANTLSNKENEYFRIINDDGSVDEYTSNSPNYVSYSDIKKSTENKIVMHNHPSGSSFSPEDLKAIVNHNEKQSIIVKNEYGTGKKTIEKISRVYRSNNRNEFCEDYQQSIIDYKTNVLDVEWNKYKFHDVKIAKEFNIKINNYRIEWLKENSKKYGYKYERKEI